MQEFEIEVRQQIRKDFVVTADTFDDALDDLQRRYVDYEINLDLATDKNVKVLAPEYYFRGTEMI